MLYGFINNKTERFYYVRDVLHNILGIIDNAGNLIIKYDYNAYGNNMTISGNTTIGNINPFRYKRYYYDNESGMYYCNSRYYNPLWCRWLNADSVNYSDVKDINCTNLYQYCGNNPVLGYDPNGNWNWGSFWRITGGIIGAVVVGTIGAAIGFASGFVPGAVVGAGVGIIVGAVAGAEIGAIVESEYYVNHNDVEAMSDEKYFKIRESDKDVGLSR